MALLMPPTSDKRPSESLPTTTNLELNVRRQYKTRIGQDAQNFNALVSLTRTPDVVVEDEIKWSTKALKAEGIASLILAAIQIQLLTVSKNGTSNLSVATNAFFCTGSLLNVIGAYYAVTSAYNLDASLFNVQSVVRGLDDKELDDLTHLPLSPLAKRLAIQNSMRPVERRTVDVEEGRLGGAKLFRETSLEKYSRSIEENRRAGYLSSLAISLGFLCFPVGFLCLLHETQTLAVRITADTVVGILVIIRYLFIPLHDRLQSLKGWKDG